MNRTMFDGFPLIMIRVACLLGGIVLISYSISTAGTQPVASFIGGALASLSVSLQRLERR